MRSYVHSNQLVKIKENNVDFIDLGFFCKTIDDESHNPILCITHTYPLSQNKKNYQNKTQYFLSYTIPWNIIGMAQALSLYHVTSSTRPTGLFLVLLAGLSFTETVSAWQAQPILPTFRPKT